MAGDMAPSTIPADLSTLTATCLRDLTAPNGRRIDGLRLLVVWLLDAEKARFTMTGSRANTDALGQDVVASGPSHEGRSG